MPVAPMQTQDPAPEAADLALAAAAQGADERDGAEPYDTWAELGIDHEAYDHELAAMYRDFDAAVLVEQTVPTPLWSDAQVVDALANAERTARAVTARGLRLAAELARRRPAPSRDPDDEGLSKYALDEISVATGLARGAARGRLAEARTVRQRFPQLLDALEAGLVTLPGVRKVVELTQDLTPAGCRAVQRGLLRRMGRPHVPDLHRADLERMLALDPTVVRSIATRATTLWIGRTVRSDLRCLEAERLVREAEQKERRVALERGRGGMAWISAYGAEALSEAAWNRIDGFAHLPTEADDQRTIDQKRADVFFDLLLGRADHRPGQPSPVSAEPAAPSSEWGASAVNLNVLVDHTRCEPSNAGGCIGEAGRLGPVTAEGLVDLIALAAETGGRVSGFHVLPEPCPGDAHHQLVGRGPYEPSERLKRQIRARWRRCTFPGCSRPARECDLDHSIPYGAGGPTCICNVTPLCEHHHLLKHDRPTDWPAWRLTNHGDHLTWVSPTGLVVHVAPDPPDRHPPPAPKPVETPPF